MSEFGLDRFSFPENACQEGMGGRGNPGREGFGEFRTGRMNGMMGLPQTGRRSLHLRQKMMLGLPLLTLSSHARTATPTRLPRSNCR